MGTQVNSYILNLSKMWNGNSGCGVAGGSLDEFIFFLDYFNLFVTQWLLLGFSFFLWTVPVIFFLVC